MKKKEILNGNDCQTSDEFKNLIYQVVDLIALNSIWVNPSHYQIKLRKPVYGNCKRGSKNDKGKIIKGIRIDDNTYANKAIKNAVNPNIKFENYIVCHIWSQTTYNENYHTRLENLVLIPKVLASFTDHSKEVEDVLKFRSFQLYGWYPKEEKEPSKPEYYPLDWKNNFREVEKVKHMSNKINIKISKDFTMEEEVNLRKLIKKVGMESFVDLFPMIAKDPEVTVLELTFLFPEFSDYSANSQATKLSNTKAIFKNNWEIEALKIIADSFRVGPVVRLRAKELLVEYN